MANHWNHNKLHPTLEQLHHVHINGSGIAKHVQSKWEALTPEQQELALQLRKFCRTSITNDEIGTHAVIVRPSRCNFGGVRFWLICPGCDGSRLVLRYVPKQGMWFCNSCLNGVHASTQMSKSDRVNKATWKRLQKYKLDKFVSGLDFLGHDWGKPKHMHWKTWRRIVDKHNRTLANDPLFQKYLPMAVAEWEHAAAAGEAARARCNQ